MTPIIFYSLFVKNKKINSWGKDYLRFLNEKGNDGMLLNDFLDSILQLRNRLQGMDENFYLSK